MAITNLFAGTKKCKNLTQYALMHGVPDYGNMQQFDMYEGGYQFLKVVSIPKFMKELGAVDTGYADLINNYLHILEYDFKGFDGLDNITVDTFDITSGITNVNMISQVHMQSASQLTARYYERSGSPLVKTHNLFLTGIKDPRTEVKTYHGLIGGIGSHQLDPGFENEIFTLLYIVTDNTARNVEKAYLLLAAQPNEAEENIYNGQKGEIELKEVNIAFNCYPVQGPDVSTAAQQVMNWMNNEDNPNKVNFQYDKTIYTGTSLIDPKVTPTAG